MRLATFIFIFLLSCALSSKLRNGRDEDKEKSNGKIHTPSPRITIYGKSEQSLPASADISRKKVNKSSGYNPLIRDIERIDASATYPIEAAHSKYVQKLSKRETEAATDVLQPGYSDGITYIPAKETYQTRDETRHEFLNASRTFESSVATKSVEGEKEGGESAGNKEKTENKSSGSTSIEKSAPLSLIKVKNNTPREIESIDERNSGAEERGGRFADSVVEKQTARSRDAEEVNWQPGEDDFMEAANFGLRAMHDLYNVQEPKLHAMGLYLGSNDPARYVAAFNDQSEEARDLARFGYAALQSTTEFLKRFPGAPLELPLSRSTRKTSLEQQCPRRGTPRCPRASLRYRTSDGSCNNLRNLWWGSAMSAMQRFLPAAYNDGVQSIRRSRNGKPLPSAREITSLIHQDKDVPLSSITHMLMQWGQFVDHDLTATGQSRGFNGTVPQCCLPGGIGFQPSEFMHPECLPIAVNLRDSFYGPLGVRCLEFLRSGPAPKEDCEFGAREQLSQVTSYLDASMVYSSNALHSDSLRIFRNGLLQYGKIQSRRPSLPKLESDLCKRGSLSTTCFRAGDGRLSEQPALTSLHIVFLRLHNRIATKLSALNLHWSDEKLFQETRRIVGAVIQHITYREFLPIILGPQVMRIFDLEVLKKGYYERYDPTINPTVANAFSTAAYRFGHSLVQQSLIRFDSDHRPLFNNVSIHDEFSNPANLETAGSVDRLILGLVNQPCQRRDEFITKEMTNHLFQTPGFAFGMDLASLNIQRGRDHGLPPYVRWRELCGLSPIRTFEDLERTMSPDVARKFRTLYSSVEDIDLYPAGLAEKSVVGGLLGPTFACIIAQQFSNLRRGDRFWYENPASESSFTAGQLQQIRRITLAQVLCKTIDGIETIQPFVFLATDTLRNQRLSCDDPTIGPLNLEFWTERPPESRHNLDDPLKAKRTAPDASGLPAISRSQSKGGNANVKRKGSNQEQTKTTPFKTSIHQNNKIVVKRPFGRPDNFTIVVQNHAINSPVFVNEGIYNSRIRIPPTEQNNYLAHRPQSRPIPTTIPHSMTFQAAHPYVPHTYNDPSNPNPLAYGYRSPGTAQDSIFYDNYSATSPKPTLYTYYTSFLLKPTTRLPDREVDVNGYLINYNGPSHHEHDSLPLAAHAHERPKPLALNSRPHESNDERGSTQKPNRGVSKSPANVRPNSRPSYASNGELNHAQSTDYERQTPKPIIPTSSRPSNAYKKPAHSVSSANSRPHGTRKPGDTANSHSQHRDNLNSGPTERYSANPNKWNSSDYRKRPGEEPYDHDDPDLYRKRPQNGLDSVSATNVPSYHEETLTGSLASSPSSAYASQGPVTNHNYNRQTDVTPAYEKKLASTQSSWTTSSYPNEEDSTRAPLESVSFDPHSLPSHQKPANQPTYQKEDRLQLPSYSKVSTDRPPLTAAHTYGTANFFTHQAPFDLDNRSSFDSVQQNRPISSTHWPQVSMTDFQAHRQEDNFSSKPTRVQSVSIVAEPTKIVHHPGHSSYISQHRITTEIPRPLTKHRNDRPVRKPGQYYYEKNVLYRYPDEVVDQIPKSNHHSTGESEKTLVQDREIPSKKTSSTGNSMTSTEITRRNESDSTTMPTRAIADYDNGTDDATDDLEGALSENLEGRVASVDVPDRTTNYWMNSREDLSLPSMLEMPEMPFDGLASAKELPKPIKLRSHAT